ncbi:conserved hypothetical protein [Pyrobaculum islandicum DSM 4184]|uniref:Uncharacterized protein n=1 Tax=Pyrobaculum islandicum (strain DSM 4184 / JCM 9189 / GEO3) TaxID=384616 RepID=A1RVP0_PYRIL|nr:hypothetical protein [Pyrobaculum islandicum]ABL89022.1 conserved hypothetical protein [Pyrobaculum islandicum DSM 4184]
MNLKTLVASVLASVVSADVHTVYALVSVARDELRERFEVSLPAVEEALRQLVDEGYAAEYEELTLDLKKRVKKYVIRDKIRELAQPLPPKTQQIAKLKYVTPTFYYLLNQQK